MSLINDTGNAITSMNNNTNTSNKSLIVSDNYRSKLNDNISSSYGMDSISEYSSYEDYLDSQITAEDEKYLMSDDLMRCLVELGYRGNGESLSREEFENRKREIEL